MGGAGRFDRKVRAKRVANRVLAAAGYAGALPLWAGLRGHLVVLTYHSVSPGRAHEMNVAPDAFAQQMVYLAERHRVLSPAAAAGELSEGRPGVCITFDDGYASVVEHALPVLTRLDLPAAMYVATGYIGSGRTYAHDAGDDHEYNRLVDWGDLSAWLGEGMELGAHTVSHARLSSLPPAEAAAEISESRAQLLDRLGVTVSGFAYPYGSAADFTPRVRSEVIDAGFDYGLTDIYGRNGRGADRFALRRIWVDASDGLGSFAAKLSGALDGVALLETGPGLALRRVANRLLRSG